MFASPEVVGLVGLSIGVGAPTRRTVPFVRVMAMVDDLMDRSRVSAAIDGVAFTRDPASCAGADVVVIDVARHAGAVAAARSAAPSAHIVAFGPHVDDVVLAQAGIDGADVVLARSVFFRDPGAAVTSK